MARKKLLTESEIRRFMKLANMGAIGDTRIGGLSLQEQPNPFGEEEEMGAEIEMGAPEGGEEEVAVEDEMEVEEPMGDEMDLGAEGGGVQVSLEDFMSAFETALEDATGEEVTIEMGEDVEAEEEVDLEGGDEEVGMEMGAEEDLGEPGGMGVEAEEEVAMPPGNRSGGLYENQDDLVKKVAQRVAARLVKESKKTEMVDLLTEKIFKRLTHK
ncbi:MAG: hypothetical protein QF858_02530 [Candidatus Pacebacteria bacterium]|jgi:hypothetical protein|nr:hypothetical protein [Candidatus Paceibacterota bacterium]|tara:strand:+ start:949 stop:1587 length:639 start_codon:yes stop_codon:yes gene_type:complete